MSETNNDNVGVFPALEPADAAAVIFSSVNSNGFSYFKQFEKYPGRLHRIYVRDPFDQWFTRGISAELPDWESLARHVAGRVEALGAKRILTFGSSMGGYASLKYAAAHPVDLCVSISPQTLIDIRLPHTPKNPVPPEHEDLAPLVTPDLQQRSLVFWGAADFVDIYNILRISWSTSRLYPVAGQDHLVAQHLLKKGLVDRLAVDFSAGAPIGDSFVAGLKVELDRRCMAPENARLICEAVEVLYRGAGGDLLDLLKPLLDGGDWPDADHIAAQVLARRHRFDEAIRFCRRATESAPSSVTIADTYADILRRAGRTEESLQAYLRCLAIRPKHYSALCALGELSMENGDLAAAKKYLDAAVEIRPRLTRAKALLERIESVG